MISERLNSLKTAGKRLALTTLCGAVLASCSPDSNNSLNLGNSGEPSAGNADFSEYVAIGDSLSAGYMDGTLYLLGQLNSLPGVLAGQFAEVGGGEFTQPLVADPTNPAALPGGNLGGLLVNGSEVTNAFGENQFDTRYVLNTETESPERLEGPSVIDAVTGAIPGLYNNMAIPGAMSFHLLWDELALNNPYFGRIATAADATVANNSAAQTPSFVTIWVGGNDIIQYAAAGGYDEIQDKNAVDQTGFPDPENATGGLPYGPKDITDPGLYAASVNGIIDTLQAANPDVKGVIANIPDLRSIPHFGLIPYNSIPMTAEEAAQTNAGFESYNTGIAMAGLSADEVAARTINFVEGLNPVVIEDEDLTDLSGFTIPSWRQATADDIIVFQAASVLGTEETPGNPATVWGVGTPLTDRYVLIPSESEAVETARLAYNTALDAIAAAEANFVLFDAAAALVTLKESGLEYGTGSVTADYVAGGAFSLDGIHLTGRGNAVVANLFIDTINEGFEANVHKANPADYPTIYLK